MAEKNINIHIGNKFRARRTTLGMSQASVAESIGVATQQIQKYEKGKNSMNAERLFELSQLLKVPVSYFFEGFATDENEIDLSDDHDLDANMKTVSDRETIEILKSFKRIKDYALRKRISDLLRTISLKDI